MPMATSPHLPRERGRVRWQVMEGGGSPSWKKSQSWLQSWDGPHFTGSCGNYPLSHPYSHLFQSILLESSVHQCFHPSLPSLQSLPLKYFWAGKVSSCTSSNVTANIWTQRKLFVGPFKHQTQVSCPGALQLECPSVNHQQHWRKPWHLWNQLEEKHMAPISLCQTRNIFWTRKFPHCISKHLLQCCYPPVHFCHPCLHRLCFSSVLACHKLPFLHLILRNANDCQNPSVLWF